MDVQSRLPWTEINANHFALWEVISEFNRPYAGTGPDIYASFQILDRCEEQTVAKGYSEEVVLQVKSIRFSLMAHLVRRRPSQHRHP
jgi:hypothetical protein